MDKFQTFTVSRLGKCFSALNLTDVAIRVPVPFASVAKLESFVASAIMSGSMNAVLSHSPNDGNKVTLRFLSTTLKSQAAREALIQRTLAQEASLLKVLLDNAVESDRMFELSTEHVDNLRRSQKSVNSGPRGEAAMPLSKSHEFEDEDVMEGLR